MGEEALLKKIMKNNGRRNLTLKNKEK